MANFKTGTVVLIHFPFTDGSSAKKRPALVLLDSGDNDLLLAASRHNFPIHLSIANLRTSPRLD